jgi:hypothetical protein
MGSSFSVAMSGTNSQSVTGCKHDQNKSTSGKLPIHVTQGLVSVTITN